MDTRLARLADVVVNHSLAIKKGEKVYITGSAVAAPLLLELYRSAIKAGALVQTRLRFMRP